MSWRSTHHPIGEVSDLYRMQTWWGYTFWWEDFDWEKGIWNIRIKSECPTLRNEGWAPKNKNQGHPTWWPCFRSPWILPRYEKTWEVSGMRGKRYRRGNFIFTSRKKVEIDGVKAFRQLRIVNQKRAWENLLKEAEFRTCRSRTFGVISTLS